MDLNALVKEYQASMNNYTYNSHNQSEQTVEANSFYRERLLRQINALGYDLEMNDRTGKWYPVKREG